MKILVVDDDRENVYMLETLLKGCGYQTASASNGADAIAALRDDGYDLTISDILMPVMDGFQLCRECKQNDKLRHMLFVFYTGAYTDEKDEEFALQLGADRFIRKPAHPEEFIKIIKDLVDQAEAGNVPTREPLLREEKEVFKRYTQLLSKKLDHKMHQLKEEANQRTRIEEKLRQSEARYKTIVEMIPEAITISDLEGSIVYVSPQTLELHGFTHPDELLGRNALELIAPEEREKAMLNLNKTMAAGVVKDLEYIMLKTDGGRFVGELSAALIKDDSGGPEGFIAVIKDITQRKRAEEKIKNSLKEKEVLLKEIHHRVKNNLQIITSLLNLQAAHIEDSQTLEVFEEIRNRIHSMALVHEKLYQSENFSRIDFKSYAEKMVNDLLYAYQLNVGIDMDLQVDSTSLDIDTAIPCGLVLNELVTNALKHAFSGRKHGRIRVSFQEMSRLYYELIVQDNGIGIPQSITIETTESLGLKLVQILTTQMNGTLELRRNRGTTVIIRFRGEEPRETVPGPGQQPGRGKYE
jgi:PAS domain S-box-containing protein